MNLEEAIKISEVEHILDGDTFTSTSFLARRYSSKNQIILAYTLKHIYIETYSGPSKKTHELKRIHKRTILYIEEIIGKEDWEPL